MKLGRRMFLKLLPAAPVAIKKFAGSAAQALANTEAAASSPLLSAVGMSTPSVYNCYGNTTNAKIMALDKLGLLPEWYWEETKQRADNDSYHIHPNIAALRSVSVAGRILMNRERHRAKYIERTRRSWTQDDIERAFYNKLHEGMSTQVGVDPQ